MQIGEDLQWENPFTEKSHSLKVLIDLFFHIFLLILYWEKEVACHLLFYKSNCSLLNPSQCCYLHPSVYQEEGTYSKRRGGGGLSWVSGWGDGEYWGWQISPSIVKKTDFAWHKRQYLGGCSTVAHPHIPTVLPSIPTPFFCFPVSTNPLQWIDLKHRNHHIQAPWKHDLDHKWWYYAFRFQPLSHSGIIDHTVQSLMILTRKNSFEPALFFLDDPIVTPHVSEHFARLKLECFDQWLNLWSLKEKQWSLFNPWMTYVLSIAITYRLYS